MAKRTYTRRTDEERIQELQDKIGMIQSRMEARKRKESPVVKEGHKVLRQLRKFMQFATDNERPDISNSVEAFAAGFERMLDTDVEQTPSPRRGKGRGRSSSED